MKVGDKAIHIPTGRPVELVKMDGDTITVHTLDDTWPHPKTGKPWGGSKWVLKAKDLREFEED